jgi:hypothetical protein
MPRVNKSAQSIQKKKDIINKISNITHKKVDNTEEDLTYDADIIIDAAKDKEQFKKEIENKITTDLTASEEKLIEKLRKQILEDLKIDREQRLTEKQKQAEIKKSEKKKQLEELKLAKQKERQLAEQENKKYYENLIKEQVAIHSKKADLYRKLDDIKQGRKVKLTF